MNNAEINSVLDSLRRGVLNGDTLRVRASLEVLAASAGSVDEQEMLAKVIEALGLPPDAEHATIMGVVARLLGCTTDQPLETWLAGMSQRRSVLAGDRLINTQSTAERLASMGLHSTTVPVDRRSGCVHRYPRPTCTAGPYGCGGNCQHGK